MDKYKTSQLGQALKRVYRGEITIEQSVMMARKEIEEVFANDKNQGSGFYGDEVGTCPLCGNKVTRNTFNYGCTNASCNFAIWLTIAGSTIPISQARKLLQSGFTDKLKFTSKQGKPFECKLKLDKDGKTVFDFERNNQN